MSGNGSARGGERASDDPVLSLSDVTVEFGGNSGMLSFNESPRLKAVNGVSLDVYENDVVALVGESGCGKTTLGKTAIGLQEPTDGTVSFRGHDIWEAKAGNSDIKYEEVRRSLQIIHQDPGSALNPNRQVMKTLEEPLKRWYRDMNFQDRQDRILAMLKLVGMTPAEDYANRYPHQLSGGEKQRVVLVRALLMNPDIILADEAISALDVSLRIEMMNLFLDLQERFNTSFIFIAHDLSNARYLAEKANGRIAVMYLGQIVEIGTVEEIIHNPTHPYTKALRWATPNLRGEEHDEMPIRTIDIPDPTDPPKGCKYHTRCPEAREACRKSEPELEGTREDITHPVSCFRAYNDAHEYWSSEPLRLDDEANEADEDQQTAD